MPLQISPFQLPNRPTLQPTPPPSKPVWGPPDMSEQLQKGIAGIGTAFEGSYARARERGAMDQLSEYYKTHPFAAGGAPGAGVGGVGGNPAADQPVAGAAAISFRGKPEDGLRVYQGLVDRGIEPHVAAGMAGNVYTESRFNAGALGDRDKAGNPTSIGYAQWRGDRQRGLFAAAQARGTDWRDPEAQLDHMAAELKGPYAKVYQAAVASGNPGAATAILARGYERPADWALRKTLGERTGAATSIFALGQGGGGGGGPPPPVAAAIPMPPPRPVAGVSAPPPVGLPPPDPTPDNIANAKAIMQQPTSDPPLKAWAGQVLRQQPGAAGQVPSANAPAPGAQPTGVGTAGTDPGNFVIPGSGQQVPIGTGPDFGNSGRPGIPDQPDPPLPPQRPVEAPPLPPPDPRRLAAAANAPAPAAAPVQFRPSGGDSTYAATADYEAAARAGLVPPPPGMARGAPPPAAGGGPAATGSLPPTGARLPPAGPVVVPPSGGPVLPQPAVPPGAGVGGAQPPPVAAPGPPPGVFRANEALAIAARGDPQVFAAMLRQYGSGTGSGEWTLEHDGQGNWMKMNKQTGETVPLAQAQGGVRQDLILPPGDARRRDYPGIPQDNKTYRVHPTASGIDIQPIDEREAKTFEHENALAQGFEGNQTVKNFRALTDATASMRASFGQNTPAGDINGVIQVLKAIDPGSTVTQNEQGMIVSSGGLPGWASAQVARLNGGAPLTPQMRADFVNAAEAQHRQRWNQTKTIVDSYRNRAKVNGLDPSGATNGFQDPAFPNKPASAKEFGGRDAAATGGPPGSSPANPIPVLTEQEAFQLPIGTYVRLPGGGIQKVAE